MIVVRVIGKMGQRNICFLGTTVLEANKQVLKRRTGVQIK